MWPISGCFVANTACFPGSHPLPSLAEFVKLSWRVEWGSSDHTAGGLGGLPSPIVNTNVSFNLGFKNWKVLLWRDMTSRRCMMLDHNNVEECQITLFDILCAFVLYTCTYILHMDIHVVDVQLLYIHRHAQLHICTCSNIHEYTHICTLKCTCDTCSYTIHIYMCIQTPHSWIYTCLHTFSACMYVYVQIFYITNIIPTHEYTHLPYTSIHRDTHNTTCACTCTDTHIAHSLGMYTHHTLQLALWQESSLAITVLHCAVLGKSLPFSGSLQLLGIG